MKKNYEKPEVEYVNFQFLDSIMGDMGGIIEGEDGVSSYDPDGDIFG